jgi:DNA polymerase III subunit delta'
MSLFDADDYLAPSDEPVEIAPQPVEELADPVVALLEDLPSDAPDAVVDAVLEEVALVEVGPPIEALLAGEPNVLDDVDESPPVRGPSVDSLWDAIRFQEAAIAGLRSAALQPVHAYLLVGSAGNGTLRAAVSFAAALLCARGGCGRCDVCQRSLDRTHPDLITVEREGASISVDQAREIIRLALRSPTEGDRKVLILTDFHMVTNAGPTLLKIIEEPPASTVFVILADHLPPELVTIASRCVQIPFTTPTEAQIIGALIDEGVEEARASRVAQASGGQLERALLLVSDDHLASRLSFWTMLPNRLDGSGAAVSALVAEALELLDHAAVGPLQVRQAAELAELEARLEQTGARGAVGQRKELTDRHKRESKRLRDDELRLGLSVLVRRYRTALINHETDGPQTLRAIEALSSVNEHLERNPTVGLLLSSLLLQLPKLVAA